MKRSVLERALTAIALAMLCGGGCVSVPDISDTQVVGVGQGGTGHAGAAAGTGAQSGGTTAGGSGSQSSAGTAGTAGVTSQGGSSGNPGGGSSNGGAGATTSCPDAQQGSPSVCVGQTAQALGTCKSIADFSVVDVFDFDERGGGGLFWWEDGTGEVELGLESDAFHFLGTGQTLSGGSMVARFAAHCYDARAYGGIAFRARGAGLMRVNVITAALEWDPESGDCLSGDPALSSDCTCGDFHGITLTLTTAWKDYAFTWAELEQFGWGARAPFDLSRALSIAIGVQNPSYGEPFDSELWVDDLEFLPVAPNTGTENCGAAGSG